MSHIYSLQQIIVDKDMWVSLPGHYKIYDATKKISLSSLSNIGNIMVISNYSDKGIDIGFDYESKLFINGVLFLISGENLNLKIRPGVNLKSIYAGNNEYVISMAEIQLIDDSTTVVTL